MKCIFDGEMCHDGVIVDNQIRHRIIDILYDADWVIDNVECSTDFPTDWKYMTISMRTRK